MSGAIFFRFFPPSCKVLKANVVIIQGFVEFFDKIYISQILPQYHSAVVVNQRLQTSALEGYRPLFQFLHDWLPL